MKLPHVSNPPVLASEHVELGSAQWVPAARAYLAPRVAERADALRGRFTICEIYENPPPHLALDDGTATVHIVVENGEVTVGRGRIDDADFRIVADYEKIHSIATAVYEAFPERKKRLNREAIRRYGREFARVEGAFPQSEAFAEVMSGLHDHMALRSALHADNDHRIERLGLRRNVAELEEHGTTIVENAISSSLADELRDLVAAMTEEGSGQWPAAGLIGRGLIWEELALHPEVLTLAHHLVGADCNLGQSIGIRKPKGDDFVEPHNDLPHPQPGLGTLCLNTTTIVALEDFTETSGTTLLVPGSFQRNEPPPPNVDERFVPILMPKGSIAMWHGGTWQSSAVRHDAGSHYAVHNSYQRSWTRTLDFYMGIDEEILARNPPAFTSLCGLTDLYEKNTSRGPRHDYAVRYDPSRQC